MSYNSEYSEALQRIYAANTGVASLRYFLDTAACWHASFAWGPDDTPQSDHARPLVVVLGYGIPEQLIYACGSTPCVLLGGSHASCQWSDDAVPRDSDPASRSILGYALRLAERADIDPLFVVPVANDNMRKIAYCLKLEGHAVLSVDVPPVATSPFARQAWERSAQTLVQEVARHVGGRVTARSVRNANQLVCNARAAILNFEQVCVECPGVLDSEARLLVTNTYYQTGDLAQWTAAGMEAAFDAAGNPRIQNAAMDIGCYEADWRGRYAADIGRRGCLSVASADFAAHEERSGEVFLPRGEIAEILHSTRTGRFTFPVRITGSGTLAVTVNGATTKYQGPRDAFTLAYDIAAGDFSFSFAYVAAENDAGGAYFGKGGRVCGATFSIR